jgi:hypothetical protein
MRRGSPARGPVHRLATGLGTAVAFAAVIVIYLIVLTRGAVL